MQLLVPTLPIYLKRLGSGEIEIGVLIGIVALASLASRPIAGRALAGAHEKRFMMTGAILYTLSSAAYLVLPPFWPLLFVRIVQGAGFGFFHTASTVYVVNMSPIRYRARIIGYFFLAANIAGAIAPPLGIELMNRFGFTPFFLVCTGVSFCMVLAVSLLRRTEMPERDRKAAPQSFLSTKALPQSIIGFFFLFTWSSMITFFPLYATQEGMKNPGLFFTTTAVMLILGRVFGGRILDIRRKEKILVPCIVLSIVAMGMLSFSHTLPMFLIVAAIWGMGHSFFVPALMSYTLESGGPSSGPVVATFYAVSDVGMFLGPLVMGFVVHYSSYRMMFLCLALVGIISLFYLWFFVAGRRQTTVSAIGSGCNR